MKQHSDEILEVLAQVARSQAGYRIRQWLVSHGEAWNRQAIYGKTPDERTMAAGAVQLFDNLVAELGSAEETLKAKRDAK